MLQQHASVHVAQPCDTMAFDLFMYAVPMDMQQGEGAPEAEPVEPAPPIIATPDAVSAQAARYLCIAPCASHDHYAS